MRSLTFNMNLPLPCSALRVPSWRISWLSVTMIPLGPSASWPSTWSLYLISSGFFSSFSPLAGMEVQPSYLLCLAIDCSALHSPFRNNRGAFFTQQRYERRFNNHSNAIVQTLTRSPGTEVSNWIHSAQVQPSNSIEERHATLFCWLVLTWPKLSSSKGREP